MLEQKKVTLEIAGIPMPSFVKLMLKQSINEDVYKRQLVTLLSNMFHKMSELEYIGMVRENIIVGDESHETIEAQKKMCIRDRNDM